MLHLCHLSFFVAITARVVIVESGQPEGPLKLDYDVPDTFKVWQAFPYGVAISDSNHDKIMECTEATRTALDPSTATVSYDFKLAPSGDTLQFNMKAGEAPGSATYTVKGDPSIGKGQFYYTDYNNCLIHVLDYKGGRCLLWLSKEAMADVPKVCIDHFEDTCGVQVPEDKGSLCPTM